MGNFLVLTTFTSQEGRVQHRTEHRAYLNAQVENGALVLAGPFVDDSQGVLIFESESEADVRAIMEADPFNTGGVFATINIHPFVQVAP